MEKQMKFKEVAAYSLGLFGFQAIVGFLNSYQAEFYHAQMAANLAVVGILILIVKIVSAIFDPIVGNMIERKNSSKGKLKPFIAYSIVPLIVMTIVLFIKVPFTGVALYAYIFVTFLLWSMAMTLGDVPSQGIAAVLTPNPEERTNVISIANTLKQIGFSAAAVIVPVVCLIVPGGSKVFGIEAGEKDSPISSAEYIVTAVVVAVLGCALFSLIYFINKERVPYTAEKMGFKEMFSALKSNKPLMMVIISYFLGAGRQMAMAIQVQTSNALLGSENYVLALGLTTAVGSMISMAITPVLIKKIGEKKTFMIMSIYGFAISMLALLVYLFITTNMIVMFVFLFLVGLQFGAVTLMPMIMVTDCVDYYEYETGKRVEGPAFSVLTLTIKVCLAIGAALGLILIQFSGYTAEATVVEQSTKDIVYFAYVGLPGIFSLLSIFPMLKYDITGEKKKMIADELQKRREKANV
ncbi:MAG: glycoside-pentoside-hexuronide (GPH):cation symporter [Faecalibacterium sp.]|nr:glycoside-pentoside-hexuronide (GPH):cation symporter [Ruminococcus sp.]MCM1392663.1 glycoside-pentoside-hexuronide (GPH):cation symporter [Ruminococcus sp.]MCM1486314.1 glycoside-pentoside-hexuronide (GPH):cation symporter [Faecalibacterium sp.]